MRMSACLFCIDCTMSDSRIVESGRFVISFFATNPTIKSAATSSAAIITVLINIFFIAQQRGLELEINETDILEFACGGDIQNG